MVMPWATEMLMSSNNETGRRARMVDKMAWRDSAHIHARQQLRKVRVPATSKATVHVYFGVSDPNRRRDPHNFFPTIKALVDGIKNAGVLVDDSAKYMRAEEPIFTDRETKPKTVLVVITWEEP